MELSFTKRNLRRALTYRDISRFDELGNEVKRNIAISLALIRFEQNLSFRNSIQVEKANGKDIYIISDPYDLPTINLINKNVKQAYQISPSHRESIIPVLKGILYETSSFCVFRFDIVSFYESFDRNSIIKKVKDDAILTNETINGIELVFNEFKKENLNGLPRGLNISSSLSEIMMEGFDKKIKDDERVLYYARYVDDIIIITNSDVKKSELEQHIKKPLT
ncbi:RNA-directed DNA polymerase [Shewanella algae]|uniref:RNA-directed DNA polymerase n=1 Tax=Shewanella algae TaxID=38313 RepID=UPI0031F57EBC